MRRPSFERITLSGIAFPQRIVVTRRECQNAYQRERRYDKSQDKRHKYAFTHFLRYLIPFRPGTCPKYIWIHPPFFGQPAALPYNAAVHVLTCFTFSCNIITFNIRFDKIIR